MGKSTKKKSFEEVQRAFEVRGYKLLSTEYVNNKTLLQYVCPKHPEVIQSITWSNFKSGHGCAYCAKTKRKTYEEVSVFFDTKGYDLLETEYLNNRTFMKYQCRKHPNIIQVIKYNSLANGEGCRFCGLEKQALLQRKPFEEIIEIFEDKGYKLLSGTDEYKNSKSLLRYQCLYHPEEKLMARYYDIYNGHGCPLCHSYRGEKRIKAFLDINGLLYEVQKKFPDLIIKRKLSYDFYLPDFNLLIEYQGQYHDGSIRKVKPHIQSDNKWERQQLSDKLKKEYAQTHNIKLLEIWYWDYDNIEKILAKELNIA